jgi:CheY-like chemotaxis protein
MLDTQTSPARIAVIDDDLAFLELMRDLLGTGEGHDVRTSADWIGSVEFISRVQPDLVILDLMMGREQIGWAVIDLLREQPATRYVPIILCSAAAGFTDGREQRLRVGGGIEFVPKPFDVDHLLDTIDRLLGHKHARVLAVE